MRVRRDILLAAAMAVATLAAACGGTTTSAPPEGGTLGGVGELPAPVASEVAGSMQPSTTRRVTPTTDNGAVPIGSLVDGNRVMLIGDSIMASTSRRYSNDMCEVLVPIGWQTEVNAETGRFIDFGDEVLDERLSAGWDTVVIMLGNNYNGDQASFQAEMRDLVVRLSPRPVVLLTVTEFRPDRREVNDAIWAIAAEFDNVRVVDWATVTVDADDLLGDDGLHLTDRGRTALAFQVGLALGRAPLQPGSCLRSTFTDDSAGSVNGGGSSSVTPTTRRPTRPTTTVGGSGGSTTTVATSGSTAPSPTTAAPVTTSASTQATTATTASTTPPAPPTTP
jgi:hypothetical protein